MTAFIWRYRAFCRKVSQSYCGLNKELRLMSCLGAALVQDLLLYKIHLKVNSINAMYAVSTLLIKSIKQDSLLVRSYFGLKSGGEMK